MLVALSDLHLTDGTTATDISPEAFQILDREILAAAAEREAREVHLVLIGDILDLVRTDYWHRREKDGTLAVTDRPWNGTLAPATGMNPSPDIERQFQDILRAILSGDSARALVAMRWQAGWKWPVGRTCAWLARARSSGCSAGASASR